MNDDLFRLSGEFLRFNVAQPSHRVRITGSSAVEYFRQLSELDADWAINLDEDAFLFDPTALLDLVQQMNERGYAACGMPDGGVVPIRAHNPVVCNAFFNVFNLRRVRAVWADWGLVCGLRHHSEHEQLIPAFARRTSWAFDNFEPYYGLFFALLNAGERILYLDAEQWRDEITTVVKHPDGRPLLLHAWYARNWPIDPATRRRYEDIVAFIRDSRAPSATIAQHEPSVESVNAAAELGRPSSIKGFIGMSPIKNEIPRVAFGPEISGRVSWLVPDAPVIQVVGPTDQWILERLARKLAAKLPYAEFVPWKPRPTAATRLVYYVNYALYAGASGLIDVGFFTHEDPAHQFLERARQVDFCVCMSKTYADRLEAQGIAHVAHVPMGFDAYRYRPRLVLGVIGLLDHPRKGKQLVERLRALPFVEIVATEGRVADEELRQLYQRVDFVLIPATVEGGPMSLLEGLGMGKPVIAPEGVGMVPEFGKTAHVRSYPAGDFEALERVVRACFEEKVERSRLVQDRTWDHWAGRAPPALH